MTHTQEGSVIYQRSSAAASAERRGRLRRRPISQNRIKTVVSAAHEASARGSGDRFVRVSACAPWRANSSASARWPGGGRRAPRPPLFSAMLRECCVGTGRAAPRASGPSGAALGRTEEGEGGASGDAESQPLGLSFAVRRSARLSAVRFRHHQISARLLLIPLGIRLASPCAAP